VNGLHLLLTGLVSGMGLAVSGAYFVGLLRRKENPAERALWTKLDLPELYEQRRRRRTLGMTIMALISVAFFLGANFINPQVRPRAALAFWLVLLILLVWLCGLALVDLADLRRLRGGLRGAARRMFYEEMGRPYPFDGSQGDEQK